MSRSWTRPSGSSPTSAFTVPKESIAYCAANEICWDETEIKLSLPSSASNVEPSCYRPPKNKVGWGEKLNFFPGYAGLALFATSPILQESYTFGLPFHSEYLFQLV